MNIEYVEPLTRGWNRMKRALFKPFDLRNWFVVGFTAFLAGLTDFHGGNHGGWNSNERFDWDRFMNFPQEAADWFLGHPTWMALIIFGLIIIVLLAVVLVWLSSRGKFMFLDNVINARALIAKPWKEYAAEANSLFIWSLLFGFVVIAILIIYLAECYTALHSLYAVYEDPMHLLRPGLWMLLGLSGIFIGVCFIDLLLTSFIVPMMYRERIKVFEAWSRLLLLLEMHPMPFVLYSLFYFVIMVFVVMGVIVLGFLTCCVGFLVLALPYVGDVVLLPITYAMRAFSVEFLEQFGPDYKIFPAGEAQVVVTPPPPVP